MTVGVLVFLLLAINLPSSPLARRTLDKDPVVTDKAVPSQAYKDDSLRNGKDFWERLVGTPSRLALSTKKEGVLPVSKYSMDSFEVEHFQVMAPSYLYLEYNILRTRVTDATVSSTTCIHGVKSLT